MTGLCICIYKHFVVLSQCPDERSYKIKFGKEEANDMLARRTTFKVQQIAFQLLVPGSRRQVETNFQRGIRSILSKLLSHLVEMAFLISEKKRSYTVRIF